MPPGLGPAFPPGVTEKEQQAIHWLYEGYTLLRVGYRLEMAEGELMRFLRRLAGRIGVSTVDPQRSLVVWRAKMVGALEFQKGERGPHGWTTADEERFDHEMRHPPRLLGPRPKRVKR